MNKLISIPVKPNLRDTNFSAYHLMWSNFLNNIWLIITVALMTFLPLVVKIQAAEMLPASLRCEYRINPQGIDEAQPRLTWRVESSERGQKQTAYRILVATSQDLLKANMGDLWDSGKISSSETINIAYAGKPLVSRQPCFWKVCTWDKDGKANWSESATWGMGLLQPDDWQADYISFRDTTPGWKDTTLSLIHI